MMTFASINTAIQAEMQLDPGLVSDAERLRFINDGLSAIGSLQLLEKVVTTQASVQYPTPPDDLLRIRALYRDNVPLACVGTVHDTALTGTPVAYILEGDNIRLYPIPDAEYDLRWEYTYSPTAAASITSGAYPDLPVGWDSLLVDYACYRAHRKNGNYLSSAQYKKDYDMSLATKVRERIGHLNSSQHVAGMRQPPTMSGDYFMPPDDLS